MAPRIAPEQGFLPQRGSNDMLIVAGFVGGVVKVDGAAGSKAGLSSQLIMNNSLIPAFA